MKITKSEIIRTEIDNVPDEDAINRVTNMLNDICRSLGELSDYDLINGYNVISNKDIKNATSRLNYLSKMIINNIYNYTLIKKAEELNSKMSSKIQFDYTEYKPRLEPRKPVRRSLSDIEEDL